MNVEDEVDELLDRAEILLLSRRWEEALELAQQARTLEPTHGLAFYQIGRCYMETGRIEEAEETFREGVVVDPDLFITHTGLSMILESQGRLEEALEPALEAIRLDPEYPLHYSRASVIACNSGDFERSLEIALAGLKVDPEYRQCLAAKCHALFSLKRNVEGEAALEDLLEMYPESHEAYSILGWKLLRAGELIEAETSFRTCLGFVPDYRPAIKGLERLTKKPLP